MGISIHKLQKPDGTIVFRLWDTRTDYYISDELNEEGLRAATRKRALSRLIYELINEDDWKQTLWRARVVKAWEKEVCEDECEDGDEVEDEEEGVSPFFDAINHRILLSNDIADALLPILLAELERRKGT